MPSDTWRLSLALLLIAAFPSAFGESSPAARTEPTTLVLGTSTQGGGFDLFGQTLAEVINATDPTLQLNPSLTRPH